MAVRRGDVFIAVGLIGLLATVALTAPRWSRIFRRQVEVSSAEEPGGGEAEVPTPPENAVERTINVKLFFEDTERGGLVLEERAVTYDPEIARQLQVVVGELIRGSEAGFASPLAGETKVLEVFVTGRGIAYVDLSKEVTGTIPSGSDGELRAVYSVVNTITLNFPAIRRVQILIDGRPAITLAGHVDLSRPLFPDLTLLAAAAPTAAPTPQS
jgi:spore germination protein GerM